MLEDTIQNQQNQKQDIVSSDSEVSAGASQPNTTPSVKAKAPMLKVLLIVVVVIVLVLGALFLLIKLSERKVPQESKNAASTIPKYPNSDDWKVKDSNVSCLFAFDGCWGAGVVIDFSTADNKQTIDNFYKKELEDLDWEVDEFNHDSELLPLEKPSINCVIGISDNMERGNNWYHISVRCGKDR